MPVTNTFVPTNRLTKASGIGYSLVNPNDPGIYGKNGMATWDNNVPVTPGDKITLAVEAPDGGVRVVWGNDKYFPNSSAIGYNPTPVLTTGKDVIVASQSVVTILPTDFTSNNVIYVSVPTSGTSITLPNLLGSDIGKTICVLSLYSDTGITTINKSTNGLMDKNGTSVNSVTITKKQNIVFNFDGTNWLIEGSALAITPPITVVNYGLTPAQSLFYGDNYV